MFATHPLAQFDCCEVSDHLYRVHPDGTGLEPLTLFKNEDLRATQPRYTPDGKWIVFAAVTPGSRSLWAIITQGGIYTHGTWQPSAH